MTDPNDSAYPGMTFKEGDQWPVHTGGLTKREWFSGMAMEGWHSCLANSELGGVDLEKASAHWVAVADRLIAELNKEVKP